MRLTQADLARATGIRPNTINELYHELADRVNLEHLDLICEALDCELDELIVRVPNRNWARGCDCLGMDRGSSGEALLSALDRPYIPSELQK